MRETPCGTRESRGARSSGLLAHARRPRSRRRRSQAARKVPRPARAAPPERTPAHARRTIALVQRPVSNPPNPWLSRHVEWLEEPPAAELQVYEEEAKSILAENDSPDIPFRWSLNPYRGCFHACAYCYARPSHQYLGFGAGTDFVRRIVVKTNAPELLAHELARRPRRDEGIALSGNTDCYQPLEASYELTRRCLHVFLEHRQPVRVITKGALVRRDVDMLARLAQKGLVHVSISIPFLEEEVGRRIEPGASSPNRRFDTLRALSEAGVPTGISISPLIPGLNETHVPALVERAAACGATSAFMTLLRLPAEVLPVFQERLREAFPERVSKVESAIREMRGGRMYDSRWERRMEGQGERWKTIEQLFEVSCRRHGLNQRTFGDALGAQPVEHQGELFA
jgi:DNA repair photolyase